MGRRKSSKQLKSMVILSIILIVIVLIAFIVFIFNVDVKTTNSVSISSVFQSKTNDTNNVVTPVGGIITSDDLVGATYEEVTYDSQNSFQVKVIDSKLYFSILDEKKFKEKYKSATLNIDGEKEIATHEYKIKNVCIQECNNKEYLLAIMEDGTMGVMNIEEAITENVFRIKNELISVDTGISRVYRAIRTFENEQVQTAIIVAANGQEYDLQKFVE